jgi:hypothetical protein
MGDDIDLFKAGTGVEAYVDDVG